MGRQGLPGRLLGGGDVVAGRRVERRQPDVRRLHGQRPRGESEDPDARAGGTWYKAYVLWLTFPPMVMLFLGKPVWLILAYGVLGAFFMPFLAVTLLWLLNTDRTPAEWRNKLHSNVLMGSSRWPSSRLRQRGPKADRGRLITGSRAATGSCDRSRCRSPSQSGPGPHRT